MHGGLQMTKTKSMIYCGLFTALIAAGAFIKIPVPVVPFTLQYLFKNNRYQQGSEHFVCKNMLLFFHFFHLNLFSFFDYTLNFL